MNTNSLAETLAPLVREAGLRLFLSKTGTQGLITNEQGSCVLSLGTNLAGLSFRGEYRTLGNSGSSYIGSCWQIAVGEPENSDEVVSLFNMAMNRPPLSVVGGVCFKLTTLKQYLVSYSSSQFNEI